MAKAATLTLQDLVGQTIESVVERDVDSKGFRIYDLLVTTEEGLQLSVWMDSGFAPVDYEVTKSKSAS